MGSYPVPADSSTQAQVPNLRPKISIGNRRPTLHPAFRLPNLHPLRSALLQILAVSVKIDFAPLRNRTQRLNCRCKLHPVVRRRLKAPLTKLSPATVYLDNRRPTTRTTGVAVARTISPDFHSPHVRCSEQTPEPRKSPPTPVKRKGRGFKRGSGTAPEPVYPGCYSRG